MKAISLWQPWASLWLSPRKVHETRHWPTQIRGLIAVHAAKKFIKNKDELDDELVDILDDEFGGHWSAELPIGALIGTVELVDCYGTEWMTAGNRADHADDYWCGNWEPGRFAWKRGAVRRLKSPIPYRGQQGFFDVDERLMATQW